MHLADNVGLLDSMFQWKQSQKGKAYIHFPAQIGQGTDSGKTYSFFLVGSVTLSFPFEGDGWDDHNRTDVIWETLSSHLLFSGPNFLTGTGWRGCCWGDGRPCITTFKLFACSTIRLIFSAWSCDERLDETSDDKSLEGELWDFAASSKRPLGSPPQECSESRSDSSSLDGARRKYMHKFRGVIRQISKTTITINLNLREYSLVHMCENHFQKVVRPWNDLTRILKVRRVHRCDIPSTYPSRIFESNEPFGFCTFSSFHQSSKPWCLS